MLVTLWKKLQISCITSASDKHEVMQHVTENLMPAWFLENITTNISGFI